MRHMLAVRKVSWILGEEFYVCQKRKHKFTKLFYEYIVGADGKM